jgi:hypothetical protein
MKPKRTLILSIVLLTGMLSAGCGGGAKRALAGKAQELMDTPATEKLDAGARIRGKVAVVETYAGMSPSLEGFKDDGSVDPLSIYFFSPRRKAQSVDEIETLVKVVCGKGKAIGSTSPSVYASECDVSLVDFKTKTVFARKKFENNIGSSETASKDTGVLPAPSEQIKMYLREFSSYD